MGVLSENILASAGKSEICNEKPRLPLIDTQIDLGD